MNQDDTCCSRTCGFAEVTSTSICWTLLEVLQKTAINFHLSNKETNVTFMLHSFLENLFLSSISMLFNTTFKVGVLLPKKNFSKWKHSTQK